MDITLAEGERVTLQVAPEVKASHRAAIFATPVTWSAAISDDGSGIVVNVAEDARTAVVHGRIAGATGVLTLSAIRLNGVPATEQHTVTVTPPAADSFGLTVSDPVVDGAE